MFNFSKDEALLVLASELYDEFLEFEKTVEKLSVKKGD